MLRPALSILLAISFYKFADVVLGYYKERLQAYDLQEKGVAVWISHLESRAYKVLIVRS